MLYNSKLDENYKDAINDIEPKNGQNKCPKCGATDISLNTNTGKLKCNYCRYEFETEKIQEESEIDGEIITSGAQDIKKDNQNIITLKCSSCGAEVVIDTLDNTQARCHWCRNILSINQQIPNGVIPDVILPFNVTKEQAKEKMETFVGNRRFFAHPKFKKEFTTDNIMGVYLPYMIVDINAHVSFSGKGEQKVKSYTVYNGENEKTYYDADLYQIEREFDIEIEGLSIESSSDKLNYKDLSKTNKVINAIMPFDIENCVKYNANYLKGYTSEKRDVNIEQLKPKIEKQSKDIAKFAANDTIRQYNRGVEWDKQNFEYDGIRWKTAYLPVWLYSYQEAKKGKDKIHYIAVNGRTMETEGSFPIRIPKLLTILVLVVSIINPFFILIYLIICAIVFKKSRNSGPRHYYEKETKNEIFNIRKVDNFIKRKTRLSNSTMKRANNEEID